MRLLLLIVWFSMVTNVHAQTVLDWSVLSKGISFELPSPEAIFPGFQKATFTSKIRAFDGEKVIITGYLLVLDGTQSTYLLSKNPMASCFFCGNGGPETILDLQFSQKQSFEMDELLTVEGVLYLNDDNPNKCYYRIEKADALSIK